ncbi:hypothetical protein AX15_007818 [Amanita polypyramis BW_CC]|nr:hypothetical protein AX15_007818 [Amanita polypyramis BW_CC]
MFRRQKSFAYSPSPLSRSCIPSEEDQGTSQAPYNHVPDRTTSPEQGVYERGAINERSSSTASSVSTLSDIFQFGHPLERMERVDSANLSTNLDSDETWSGSLVGSQSSSSDSFVSTTEYINFDSLIESVHSMEICSYMTQDHYITVSPSPAEPSYKLMVRTLSRTSEELRILNDLNQSNHRADPWNPAPHLLCTFDHEESDVCTCFEHLTPYDQPPLRTVSNYIDFFGQVLEGLTFLHEHSIVNLNCSKASSFMVDLSAGFSSSDFLGSPAASTPYSRRSHLTDRRASYPHSMPSSSYASSHLQTTTDGILIADDNSTFDRTKLPVKYYLVDFSSAIRLPQTSSEYNQSSKAHSMSSPPYLKDVKDLGQFLNSVIDNIPQLASKFKPLISAMATGEFTADGARKLFEALCHSLEASVFDAAIEAPSRRCSTTSPGLGLSPHSSQSNLETLIAGGTRT